MYNQREWFYGSSAKQRLHLFLVLDKCVFFYWHLVCVDNYSAYISCKFFVWTPIKAPYSSSVHQMCIRNKHLHAHYIVLRCSRQFAFAAKTRTERIKFKGCGSGSEVGAPNLCATTPRTGVCQANEPRKVVKYNMSGKLTLKKCARALNCVFSSNVVYVRVATFTWPQ